MTEDMQALRCVLLGAALCGPADLYAKTELLTTQPGSLVHWSRAVITVGFDAEALSRTVAGDAVRVALEQASDAWNTVRAEQPRFEPAVGTPPDVTIRFCKGQWQGETVDLGRSKFTASLHDGTVTGATVEINECDHRFAAPSARSGYDLQAVLTHELGHVLGLGHSDNRAAIMFPSGGGATVRAPHIEDQVTLALIYFGRGRADAGKPIGSSQQAHPGEGSVDAALRSARLQANIAPQGIPPEKTGAQLPAGSVSLLSLKTTGGRDVMVYTCEPTLLPPMDVAPDAGQRRPTKRMRR